MRYRCATPAQFGETFFTAVKKTSRKIVKTTRSVNAEMIPLNQESLNHRMPSILGFQNELDNLADSTSPSFG